MGFLFEPVGLYILSGIFIIYSLVLWFLPPLTKTKKRKIKVTFFALWSMLFAAYYNILKIPSLNYSPNKFGIPQSQWIFVINFLGFTLAGLIIYTLLSSRGIKSLKKDGIDFSDEDDEVVIATQTEVMADYEDIFKAEYKTIREIPDYCFNLQQQISSCIQGLQEFSLDIDDELTKAVERYLNNKQSSNQSTSIQISIIEKGDLHNLKKSFGLNFLEFRQLEKKLRENEGYINNSKSSKLLIFPYFSYIKKNRNVSNGNNENNAQQYIVLNNNENFLFMEQYAILNVLRSFEAFLSSTILEIISLLDLEEDLEDDVAIHGE